MSHRLVMAVLNYSLLLIAYFWHTDKYFWFVSTVFNLQHTYNLHEWTSSLSAIAGKPHVFPSCKKWNESGFRPPLCTYRLNWARRTSWGWWDDWDDTVLQTQDSKFEPWRSEAEHATSRSRRLPTILTFTRGWGRNIFVSFKPPRPGTEPRTLAWKAAVLTTTLGPPPSLAATPDVALSLVQWRLDAADHGPIVIKCLTSVFCKLSYLAPDARWQKCEEFFCCHPSESNFVQHWFNRGPTSATLAHDWISAGPAFPSVVGTLAWHPLVCTWYKPTYTCGRCIWKSSSVPASG